MDSPTIHDPHTRAICDEIGERLRTLLKSSMPDETADLDDKLRQFSDSAAEPAAPVKPDFHQRTCCSRPSHEAVQ